MNNKNTKKYINSNYEKYFQKSEVLRLVKKLYKIPRSILGKGFRDSLDILGDSIDLNIKRVKSGSKVLDWTVPNEWNIKDAYIITPEGKKIAKFKKNNLHVLGYSIPINKTISLEELKKNIYTLPEMQNAIPYVTSYYKKNWGFCMSHSQFRKLKKGKYKVFIDSSLKPGNLVYSDTLIPGRSKKEILLSTYLCHPQMVNHELSGPIAMQLLYKIIKETAPHKYSYRFLICPENIGAAAFLHNSKKKVKNIIAGYILTCLGYGEEYTYKKSRRGDTVTDKAALNVLKNSKKKHKIVDFFPDGSDERQFCSPGFNLPIGLMMRRMYGEFKEYHTSLDNMKLFSVKTLFESVKMHLDLLSSIENNFTPLARVQYGSPQLSKSKIKLYSDLMDFRINKKKEETRFILESLNLADGSLDYLDIANKKSFRLIDHLEDIKKLLDSKYLKEIKIKRK